MNGSLLTVDTRDLQAIQRVLTRYREVTRKSKDEIIANEASQWSFELYKQFKKISPKPEALYKAAVSRAFRVRREANSITKTDGLISRAAQAAAESQLGTDKSDLFRVQVSSNGVFIKPVRFSSRKSEKLLMGGRTGRKFVDSAKRAKNTSEEAIQKARESDTSIKRLNLRALGVAIELGLRSRAAKGGTMAVQWLSKVWSKRKSSTIKTGTIINRSSKGIPLGTVEFKGSGDSMSVELGALVPGTARQISRHGIIRLVEAARVADRQKYILRKMKEAQQKALEGSGKVFVTHQ